MQGNCSGNEYEKFAEQGGEFGGMFDGIAESVLEKVLDTLGLDKDHVDKAKSLIDMIEFTKVDGQSVLVVKVGSNIEVRIRI